MLMSTDGLPQDPFSVAELLRRENKFDEMLRLALQRHSEPVPDDFTARICTQIREADQQRILARVVLQERLALAACIALGGIVLIVGAVFPDLAATAFRSIAASLTEQTDLITDRIPQMIRAFGNQWQSYTVLGGLLAFGVYSLAELVLGQKLRIA
jgi:hypothetical protein